MPATTQSILDTRRHQMFPILEPAEIERVRRFGKVRAYRAGEALATVGEVGLGLTVILAGKVDITQRHESDRSTPIVTHEAGAFMGELAQLAGRPALVDDMLALVGRKDPVVRRTPKEIQADKERLARALAKSANAPAKPTRREVAKR